MSNITEQFVEYLIRKHRGISDDVRKQAYNCKLDYEANVLAGAKKNKDKWNSVLSGLPRGKVQIYGYDLYTDGKTAAMINGFNAHSLEMDDGHRFGMIHLGASIISAIDAAKEYTDIDDRSCYDAIVIGYEAACRVAMAIQPGHKEKGFHASGTCGTIGSAAGVAFALGMDQEQIKRTITLAATSAAGLIAIQEQNSELKPYNIGRAAMDGLACALVGGTAFQMPDDILGDTRGPGNVLSGGMNSDVLLKEEPYYEIERIYIKPYASCRHTHSAIDAALKLRSKVHTDEISKITVEIYKNGIRGHDHTVITGEASAKLSIPYAVSVALIYGDAGIGRFEPLDPRAVELSEKVCVRENPELTKMFPGKRASIVSIELRGGNTFSCEIDYAKGEPENPMSESEIRNKKHSLKQYEAKK